MSETAAPKSSSSAPTVVLPAAAPQRRCQNCEAQLLGEHCYACGQPTKGLVRQFSSIIGDFLDSVFELDSRILRTLGPLLLRPGFLSTEYFAGRRVRYVSPVRLFVFMSLIAFFAAQLSFDLDRDQVITGDAADGVTVTERGDRLDTNARPARRRLAAALTVEDVEAIRAEALGAIEQAREGARDVPGMMVPLDIAVAQINEEAEARLRVIHDAEARGEPVPAGRDVGEDGNLSFNGRPWDPVTNPIAISWLPDALNRKLNESAGRAKGNIGRIEQDPNLLKDAFLSTVPTTLFVLLPLFALLLKIAYVFKRRLYMEHLIVALHSHSFLCMALFLVVVFDALKTWTASLGFVSGLFGWLEVAMLVWMPVYLLLMQKRVYRQGWIMTVLKYGVLGTCYFFLLVTGATVSLLVSLVNV
ncbi:DUF3667 domain-containing protein [Arenimonas composti]|uniref:DUF3667 domain-containing protein n=1 Tax=Arenimonas composti TR7-09 = DSM 18010 TaxID=1121013 RepID=A0A091BB42_9GAMM|nr:DUF3667 domain-containing protein [Arenimonas composti]KFN49878.1 hypothetical protein P873_08525 [Arenimonas composti TR7-09 = DSM 18010]